MSRAGGTGGAGGAGAGGAKGGAGSKGGPAAGTAAGAPTAPAPAAVTIAPSGELHLGTLIEFPGTTSAGLATAFTKECEYYYEYGESPSSLTRKTPQRTAAAGSVARDRITGLPTDATCHFRLAWREKGAIAFSYAPPGRFSTMKAPGASFSFAIEADPHFDENSSGMVYEKTLARMAADAPDFVIDLGDTAMTEKLATDSASCLARYRLVRSYWDNLGAVAPFFMVAGNHDGEQGWPAGAGRPSGTEMTILRRTWLLDAATAPSNAYSVQAPTVYSFTWGDALFVVLDPYLAEKTKPTEDGWTWTLGKAQYDWLSGVLARSKASFRFVFIHNLAGGKGKDARGGADWARYYEWGGLSADATEGFAKKRPGWSLPLAALFAKHGVDAVFHGHDHFYAKEEKDGIIYQEVPQPSLAREQPPSAEFLADYGYSTGTFLPSPGYLRVAMTPDRARVEYVRSADGSVAASYELTAGGR